MSEYDNPRPTAGTPYSDPCAVKDMSITLGKLMEDSGGVTTYNGKSLMTLTEAMDLFGFGVAPFTFADGGTLDSLNLLVSNSPTDGFLYKYVDNGVTPLVIAPSFNPVGSVSWEPFVATDAKFITSANVTVSGIKNLVAPTVTGQSFSVTGFYSGTTVGGGNFIYDASKDKADHNGGTVIAPEAIAAWDGSQVNLSTLLDWAGTGAGCFVRVASASVSPSEFGADNSGSSFVTAAFQAAQAASDFIVVPPGTYLVDRLDKIRIFSNKTWFFMGCTFIKSTGAGTIMACEFESDFNLLGAARFVGSATVENMQDNTGNIGEVGLLIESCASYKVGDFSFRNMAGVGLKMTGATGATDFFGSRGRFENISASVCHFGIDIDAGNGSEYNTFNNYDLSANRVGLRMGAGNNTFGGGSITGNRYANVWLTGGNNNGHGSMVATTINHAGVYNLLAEDVTVGYTFGDCMWYGNALNSLSGQIFIRNSEGICIDGGHLDCWATVWKESSTGYNTLRNMWCPGGYGKVRLDDNQGIGLYPQNLLVSGCYGEGSRDAVTGASINGKDCEVVLVRGPNGGQVLTANTYTVLEFPGLNNILTDNRRAWNGATSLFTVPVQMGGVYSVSGRITLQTTGTIDIKTTRLRVLKNGSTLQVFRAYSKDLTADDTDICSIQLDLETLLTDGDTLQFEVNQTGTGTPVWADPDGQMVIRIEKRQ